MSADQLDRHAELRADIHRVIANYPSNTVYGVIGVLEVVKTDLLESKDKEEAQP